MSTPADFDPHTPFDAQLNAANSASADTATSNTATTAPDMADSSSVAASATVRDAKVRWSSFSKGNLLPTLRRERQLSHAMQLAMAAIGGALLVVVTSTVIGLVIPHPDTPTVANNQHPLVTIEDLTAKALADKQTTQESDSNAVGADGNTVTMPSVPTLDSNGTDTTDASDGESAADSSADASSDHSINPGSLTSLVSDPKRERKRARREQDRILEDQRQLEDRKRDLDRQIEDKQTEERRRQEDQTLAEARIAEDQKRRDDRRNEDEQLRAQEQQHDQSQNNDPKFAQAPQP